MGPVLQTTEFQMSFVKQESTPILMNLIYMEITHNTDDSARDLSSLDEGEEMKNKVRVGWRFLPWPYPGPCR